MDQSSAAETLATIQSVIATLALGEYNQVMAFAARIRQVTAHPLGMIALALVGAELQLKAEQEEI